MSPSRGRLLVSLMAAGAVAGCAAGPSPTSTQTTPATLSESITTPSASAGRMVVPTPIPEEIPGPTPTEAPALGSPWSPGSQTDIDLADELVRAWDEKDVDALDTVYAPDMALATGPGGYIADLEGIRGSFPTNGNSYARVSRVTATTSPVPGLPRLPSGYRYLHFVSLIHGDLFDTILQVDDSDLVHLHFADSYLEGSVRLQTGFPDFPSPTPSAP